MEKSTLFLLFLTFLSLFLASAIIFENNSLNSKINLLNQQIQQQQGLISSKDNQISELSLNVSNQDNQLRSQAKIIENYSRMLYSYQSRLSDLEIELNITKSSLSRSTDQLSQTRAEINTLSSELSSIENKVDSSISWFKDNSLLPSHLSGFKDNLEFSCVHSNIVNLACVPHLLEREYNFVYKLDNADKLYSISEMIERSGGDCEDYSLFLMATINNFKKDNSNLQLESWEESNNRYVVYQSSSFYWFYNGTPKNLGKVGDLYPYMICFTTYFDGVSLEGHCVVALSEYNLQHTSDIAQLNGADIFEPQNGEYLGKVGQEYLLCVDRQKECELQVNYISLVVSDSDLTSFSDGKWSNYLDYKQKISSLKKDLLN
ncbi:MAG: hypothetical protein ACP5N9_05600 [Candidatus Bilamarchaeum sp.]|jgi:hypothetical protein